MINHTSNPQAALEDAQEEELRIPKAGDILTEQDAYLLKTTGLSSRAWGGI